MKSCPSRLFWQWQGGIYSEVVFNTGLTLFTTKYFYVHYYSAIVDNCVPNPCLNGASCHMGYGNIPFICVCQLGYVGTLCETCKIYKYIFVIQSIFVIYSSFISNVYSEVPIIRPPMVLVESGLNNEQVS